MSDDFDDILLSRLQNAEPAGTGDAHQVLAQLQPAMRRARIRRTIAVGGATLSVVGISVLGLAAVTTSLREDPAEVDILRDGDPLPETSPQVSTTEVNARNNQDAESQPDGTPPAASTTSTIAPSTTAETTVPSTTSPIAVPRETSAPTTTAGPAVTVAPTTSADPSTQPTTPASTSAPSTAPASTSPPSTSPPTTAAPTTTPTTTATTAPSTTRPPASGQQTINSNCGSISVSYSGDSITLTATQPAAGYTPDIKNAGPSEVEVGFADGSGECEIKARMDDGQLRTDVDNDDGEDDD